MLARTCWDPKYTVCTQLIMHSIQFQHWLWNAKFAVVTWTLVMVKMTMVSFKSVPLGPRAVGTVILVSCARTYLFINSLHSNCTLDLDGERDTTYRGCNTAYPYCYHQEQDDQTVTYHFCYCNTEACNSGQDCPCNNIWKCIMCTKLKKVWNTQSWRSLAGNEVVLSYFSSVLLFLESLYSKV